MGAFTLELYLKCLLKLQCGTFPATHDLEKLFRNLPPATRDSLRKAHDSRAENDPAFTQFRRQFGLKTDLDSLLETGRNVFEILRYLHEGNPTGTWALNIFTWCVQQAILSLHPEFANPIPNYG
jgi:hypothetical protein